MISLHLLLLVSLQFEFCEQSSSVELCKIVNESFFHYASLLVISFSLLVKADILLVSPLSISSCVKAILIVSSMLGSLSNDSVLFLII